VRAHGSDPISYSTLQPGLEYFETSYGYIAYRRALGFDLTLGPPICAASDRAELIQQFLRSRRSPLFFYVQKEIASLAAELGGPRFRRCGMGIDKVLALDGPHEEASPKVRGALKKAAKGGFEISEIRASELTAEESSRLDSITRSYLSRSAVPEEMHFLNRPLHLVDDGFARIFLLREAGRVFGYAVLDPYFDAGRVEGYLLNLIRFEPTRLWGVYYSAVSKLVEQLRAEGVGQLSLGFCPMTDVEIDTDGSSGVLGVQVRWLERQLARVGYFARLRELKEAFPGSSPQRYFVSPSPSVPSIVLAFLRASRVPFAPIIRRMFSKTGA
jgi:lysylphosphatidylglycerol synthetase-like protein (DUF2156 family)